jgi:TctA family transporter
VQPPNTHRVAHLGECGWFWAWAVVGSVLAAGIEILPLLLVAGLLAVLASRFQGSGDHLEGMLTGFGLPFLYVAYINRTGMDFSPWPWLVIGTVFALGGVVLYARNRRSAGSTDRPRE